MTMDQKSLSQRLAGWATEIHFEDLPNSVIKSTKRALLDFLGVTIAGSTTGLARSIQEYVRASDQAGVASIFGTNSLLSESGAAFANGVSACVLELDDVHERATLHLGATCIPAILAAAQTQNVSSRDVICAIAVGFEISSRLGTAIRAGCAARGFHTTPLLGVIGATLGVTKILGSSTDAVAHALGLAGSNAGGLFDYHGGWPSSWCINIGKVGREAILCARLSQSGIVGPMDIFEGPKALFLAFAGEMPDESLILNRLGDEWEMLNNTIKVYPCCRRAHSVIDAVLAIKFSGKFDWDDVDFISIETSADSAKLDGRLFSSMSDAQMSIPYGAAAALVFGAPKISHFEESARSDSKLLRMVDRVVLFESNDAVISDPRRFAARVCITINGKILSATVTHPIGDPAHPVSDEYLEAKFYTLAAPVIGQERAQRIVDAVRNFDSGREFQPAVLSF